MMRLSQVSRRASESVSTTALFAERLSASSGVLIPCVYVGMASVSTISGTVLGLVECCFPMSAVCAQVWQIKFGR